EGFGAEDLGIRLVQRRLEGGGGNVPVEHARVLVVEDRGLDAAAEECGRLAHEVLVERVLARDEDRQPVTASARSAPLLEEDGHGPRKADREARWGPPDVDPGLRRVRGAASSSPPAKGRCSISRRGPGV